MNSFRFSIEWSRVEPEPGKWDYAQIEHYHKMIKSLRRRSIEPMPCLLHFTEPVWFNEMGGFEKRKNVHYYARFCEKVMTELGDDVTYVYTINEPNVYMGMTYFAGEWLKEKSYLTGVKYYFNLMKAHKEAYSALKHLKSGFQIGIAQHCVYGYPASKSNPIERVGAWLMNWSVNWFFINRTKPYHDFIGINFYASNRVKWFKMQNLNERQNDMGWEMSPYNLRHVLKTAYFKYQKPIIISENGVADHKDQYRQWWLTQTLHALSDSISKDGVLIKGYTHWSLLDNFEWSSGFWPRFGLVEVERATLRRIVRPSAKWFGAVIAKLRSAS